MQTLAELRAAGWDGISIYCSPCQMIVAIGFGHRKAEPTMTLADLAQVLRCRRCGKRPAPENVRVIYASGMARKDERPAPPGEEPTGAGP